MTQSASAASGESRRFEFRRCLGVGGFGEVYLARMVTGKGLSRDVAVKLLLATLDPSAAMRLRDEARLLAALNHRAILQIYDLMELDGRAALVTEYVDGLDLAGVLAESGVLSPKLALEVVGEVAGALHAALTTPAPGSEKPLGLVHRDIKPANIRIVRSGAVKLLDFGIAVSAEVQREAKTGTGLIVGTLGYLAPERVTEEGVRPPSDVYALGCVLYEAIVGEKLYAGIAQSQTFRIALQSEQHASFVRDRLARVEALVGEPVRALLERTLAFLPGERPDASALEQACEELATTLPGPNLRRWARERAWADPPALTGSLDGRTIETVATLGGTVAPVGARPLASGSLTPRRSAVPRIGLVVGLGVGMALLLGLLGTLAVGTYALFASSAGVATSSPPITSPPVVAAGTQPSLPKSAPILASSPVNAAATSPGPSPAPSSARLSAARATVPAPPSSPAPAAAPAASSPSGSSPSGSSPAVTAPTPASSTAMVATGTVSVLGGVPVELRSAGGSWPAGRVPAGTYEVWADFGAGYAHSGRITVSGGGTVTLRCSAMMLACQVASG